MCYHFSHIVRRIEFTSDTWISSQDAYFGISIQWTTAWFIIHVLELFPLHSCLLPVSHCHLRAADRAFSTSERYCNPCPLNFNNGPHCYVCISICSPPSKLRGLWVRTRQGVRLHLQLLYEVSGRYKKCCTPYLRDYRIPMKLYFLFPVLGQVRNAEQLAYKFQGFFALE